MKHYFVYHNTGKMGYSVAEDDAGKPTNFSIVTNNFYDDTKGCVVWLVSGEGTPRRYYLEYWFFIAKVETPSGNPEFKFKVSGTDGISTKRIPLNHLPWFEAFQESQANFVRGFNPIADKYVPKFCAAAASGGFPAPNARKGSANHDSAEVTEEDSGPAARRKFVTEQLIRDSAVVTKVKRLHDHTCQVCGVRLLTPAGPYAVCAHIRPLGSPHNGPDKIGNVLCLCPNDHALFDAGSFSIRDNMTFIRRKGSLRIVDEHQIDRVFLAYHRKLFNL